MAHSRTVEAEFGRQAKAFSESPDLRAPEITRPIVEALADLDAKRVLDLACGPGVLTGALGERAQHVVSLDLTEQTLRLARDRSPSAPTCSFVRGLCQQAPFPAGSFDAAVLRLALHHCEEPAEILAEARRLLRPGGRVVVLDILTSADPDVAQLHNAIERLRDPSHTAVVTQERLRDQIVEAGFALISERSWQGARAFAEWARIIAEPQRMASLEVVLRHLARAGVGAGIDLREREGGLEFTYRWALLVAERA